MFQPSSQAFHQPIDQAQPALYLANIMLAIYVAAIALRYVDHAEQPMMEGSG